jgi:Golgi nucleoside diphosphatase
MKVSPGLSAYDGRPLEAAAYVRPLIEHAAQVVPKDKHAETPLFIKATAGMRLLAEVRPHIPIA